MASCVANSYAKNYQNLIIRFQVMTDKFWCVFMSHSVHELRNIFSKKTDHFGLQQK